MNSINVVIVNPKFIAAFMATPLICCWLVAEALAVGVGSSTDVALMFGPASLPGSRRRRRPHAVDATQVRRRAHAHRRRVPRDDHMSHPEERRPRGAQKGRKRRRGLGALLRVLDGVEPRPHGRVPGDGGPVLVGALLPRRAPRGRLRRPSVVRIMYMYFSPPRTCTVITHPVDDRWYNAGRRTL